MSGFGTGRCGICNKRIRWDDAFCSDPCQTEADRRSEYPPLKRRTPDGYVVGADGWTRRVRDDRLEEAA